jgi:hypothetical protein
MIRSRGFLLLDIRYPLNRIDGKNTPSLCLPPTHCLMILVLLGLLFHSPVYGRVVHCRCRSYYGIEQ